MSCLYHGLALRRINTAQCVVRTNARQPANDAKQTALFSFAVGGTSVISIDKLLYAAMHDELPVGIDFKACTGIHIATPVRTLTHREKIPNVEFDFGVLCTFGVAVMGLPTAADFFARID